MSIIFDAISTELTVETLHDVKFLFVIGDSSFGQQPEQYGELHMVVSSV